MPWCGHCRVIWWPINETAYLFLQCEFAVWHQWTRCYTERKDRIFTKRWKTVQTGFGLGVRTIPIDRPGLYKYIWLQTGVICFMKISCRITDLLCAFTPMRRRCNVSTMTALAAVVDFDQPNSHKYALLILYIWPVGAGGEAELQLASSPHQISLHLIFADVNNTPQWIYNLTKNTPATKG